MPICEYCDKDVPTKHGLKIHQARCSARKKAPEELTESDVKKIEAQANRPAVHQNFWRTEHGDEMVDEIERRVGKKDHEMSPGEFCTAFTLLRRERRGPDPVPPGAPEPGKDRDITPGGAE